MAVLFPMTGKNLVADMCDGLRPKTGTVPSGGVVLSRHKERREEMWEPRSDKLPHYKVEAHEACSLPIRVLTTNGQPT